MNLKNLTIPHWVNWIAQDADGAWWGYQVEPLQNHSGWYENEIGRIVRLIDARSNLNWQSTLKKFISD